MEADKTWTRIQLLPSGDCQDLKKRRGVPSLRGRKFGAMELGLERKEHFSPVSKENEDSRLSVSNLYFCAPPAGSATGARSATPKTQLHPKKLVIKNLDIK